MNFSKKSAKIRCKDAEEVFLSLRENRGFLFESKDISHIYGRLSLIGVDPVLEISGKGSDFEIKVLNNRGDKYVQEMGKVSVGLSYEVIKGVLEKFKVDDKEFIGLYGAFAYDFVRQFEKLPVINDEGDCQDFRLHLYDTFVFFDHLKEVSEVICYRDDEVLAASACEEIVGRISAGDVAAGEFKVSNSEFELSENDYEGLVENARELARSGELFEVVYSNTLRADFDGDSFGLYVKYAEINPSPYLFYFNFGDEVLVGASPEMMVRCEDGMVHMRPISGTAKRGDDPIEDHENMMELLSSEKERAELDMLIDLGRNDLSRICKPGVEITDYRFVEKYSKVMHTVAHVSGYLDDGYTAFDSLIACINAGTLTGAPKVAAMTAIEKNEKSRRGYYGGTIGYLTFSGEMDTGIIIRTAHIKDGRLSFRVGATLLFDSDPRSEYLETINKAQAFLTTIA